MPHESAVCTFMYEVWKCIEISNIFVDKSRFCPCSFNIVNCASVACNSNLFLEEFIQLLAISRSVLMIL